MTSAVWTPAARPGIIPLHPLPFGTILGRSFVALRQNPKVLLGFAVVVQALGSLLMVAAIVAVTAAAFSRLDNLRPSDPRFDTVLIGSSAIVIIASIVLSILVTALSTIVQAVVVADVARAAVAEKNRLGQLWRTIAPSFWRLMGYMGLLSGVILVAAVAFVFLIGIISVASEGLAILTLLLVLLGAVPLVFWITTKLLLVIPIIVLERSPVFAAIGRSWRLVRGRFWSTFGIWIIISMSFAVLAQIVSIPFSFLGMAVGTIVSPTGDPEVAEFIEVLVSMLVVQAVGLVIQAVATVVQATASCLVYIDCRMRREGLDLDLIGYVDARDAGAPATVDPYRAGIGRTIAPRYDVGFAGGYGVAGYPPPQGYGPPQGYPLQGYGPPQGYPLQRYGPQQTDAPAYPPPTYGPPPQAYSPAYVAPQQTDAPAPAYPPPTFSPPPQASPPAYPPPLYAGPQVPPAPAPSSYPAPPAPPVPPAPAPEAESRAATDWTAPGAEPPK